jgi:hypothetical protein
MVRVSTVACCIESERNAFETWRDIAVCPRPRPKAQNAPGKRFQCTRARPGTWAFFRDHATSMLGSPRATRCARATRECLRRLQAARRMTFAQGSSASRASSVARGSGEAPRALMQREPCAWRESSSENLVTSGTCSLAGNALTSNATMARAASRARRRIEMIARHERSVPGRSLEEHGLKVSSRSAAERRASRIGSALPRLDSVATGSVWVPLAYRFRTLARGSAPIRG